MAVLIRPRQWGRQKPPPGAQVDWNHPLANGLIFCMLPTGAGAPLDLISGKFGSPTSLTQRNTAVGQAAGFNGTSGFFSFANFPVGGLSLLSAYFWRSVDSFASTTVVAELSANYSLNTGSFGLFLADGTSPTNVTTSAKGSNGTAAVTGFADPAANTLHQYVQTLNMATAANTWPQYLDGLKPATTTPYAANATITPAGTLQGGQTLYVGARAGTGAFTAGGLPILAFYNRVLTQDEAMRLYVEPYAFLRAQSPRQRYWITPASTVDLTLTDTPGSLRAAGGAQTLTLGLTATDTPTAARGHGGTDTLALGATYTDTPTGARAGTPPSTLTLGLTLADAAGNARTAGTRETLLLGVTFADIPGAVRGHDGAQALTLDLILGDKAGAARAAGTVQVYLETNPTPTPAERIYRWPVENRTDRWSQEDRTDRWPAESRVLEFVR